ncbi:MAG TPA: AMP-binding protein [Dehalococcoidia bacterium]|nr:AMP-binding protein [Dehalococcoidia bacterium]
MQLTIPVILDEAARRFERKTAFQIKVGREFKRLTYGELRQQARAFGSALIAAGLKRGDKVGIVCENGLEWIVGYLGISCAAGIAVPIYYDLSEKEIEEALRRAEARFAIVSEKALPRISDRLPLEMVDVVGPGAEARSAAGGGLFRRPRARVLPFEGTFSLATPESDAALAETFVDPEELASIVYTSGTTGGAKGVMLSHRNFMSNVEAVPKALTVTSSDSILLLLPLHHSYPFTVEFLLPLSVGAAVTIENDLVRTRDRLAEVKPTLFGGVPALLDIMYRAIRAQADAQGRGKTFEKGLNIVRKTKQRTGVNIGPVVFRELHQRLGGKLRFIASGGAALNPETALNFHLLGILVLQGWGLTETSPIICAQRYYPARFRFTNYYERQLGAVGRPLPGVDIDLIDVPAKDIYVKLHDEGELIARGPNVMQGYWKAEAETKAAMIGDWIRTGDVGRIDRQGYVHITGRSKYVIVLDSGEKVHPDEVEESIQRSPLVEDVCVVSRKVRDRTQMWAVVYPNHAAVSERLSTQDHDLGEPALRTLVESEIDALEETLAPYKRTSRLVLTDTPLPKTAMRKVSREQIAEDYSFDVKRWRENSTAGLIP